MTFKSINPATGELLASYELFQPAEVQDIVQRSIRAQRLWFDTDLEERARYLNVAHDHLLRNREQYAGLMSREMGKIYKQGIAEIDKCAWA